MGARAVAVAVAVAVSALLPCRHPGGAMVVAAALTVVVAVGLGTMVKVGALLGALVLMGMRMQMVEVGKWGGTLRSISR